MMNLDQARAGGEGFLGVKKKPSGKDKNVEMNKHPPIFQGEEEELNISVPQGWAVKKPAIK
jgi:hypothetical protein